MNRCHARGLTIIEVLSVSVALLLLAGFALPMISANRCDSMRAASTSNLRQLGIAHATYAADWNDRQFTLVRDDLSQFGNSLLEACQTLESMGDCQPPVVLGADCDGVDQGFFFGCDDGGGCMGSFATFVPPINFESGFGSFRLPNARGFHEYVNGRFFDPIFYAPKDAPVRELVEPLFDVPCEFVSEGDGGGLFWSSYVLSPAAMYHPDVLSSDDFHDPFSFALGHESPTVSQAKYPGQKTRMIEHHWLQTLQAGSPCNPAIEGGTYDGCEPYYFNQAWRSNPTTLFFDGHVRGLSVREAQESDTRFNVQSAPYSDWLWSRDTPLGGSGYFIDLSYDWASTSYHILTTNGIRGRDTLR